ncbi:MAG: response regulator [Acidobacteria bacterium]|nr:response regulator [Acidobacteriota bacterium]
MSDRDHMSRHGPERHRNTALLESLPTTVYEADPGTGRYLYVTPRAGNLLGYPVSDWIQRSDFFPAFVHPEDRARVVRERTAAIEHRMATVIEFRALAADGRVLWLRDELCLSPVGEAEQPVICGVLSDITERRRLDEESWQARRLEAIGQIAGGVAHEFNNLMATITGYSSLLLRDAGVEGGIMRPVEGIMDSAVRGAALTRQLLAFSRQQILDPVAVNLNVVLHNIGSVLGSMLGEDIRVVTSVQADLWPIRADPGQLEQVLLNLARNARDAMPDGGTLTLETTNVTLVQPDTTADIPPGSYAQLAITDTGCGMDEETQARAFEPFFSTKGGEHGSGMGLPTVHGVTKQSGGGIKITSAPGTGTTIRILLPRVDATPETGQGSALQPSELHGTETIMLVEDEDAVREMAEEVLTRAGYRALTAPDGLEALRRCDAHGGPIHLVVTDVIMPRLGGVTLARWLTASRPELKILFISGYAGELVNDSTWTGPRPQLLQKPFTTDELLRKIRDVLAS